MNLKFFTTDNGDSKTSEQTVLIFEPINPVVFIFSTVT